MLAFRRSLFVQAAAGFLFAAAATFPASVGMAADAVNPLFGANTDAEQVAAPATPAPETASAPDEAEIECMAKVVLHEAANQPYDGKVAVAQTLANRLAAGRFGGSICEVANQRGQFFNTAAYNPDRDSDGWTQAVAVARSVLSGTADAVAPGAIFFRAAYSPSSSFFRSRQRVASVGAHIFYR